MDRVKKRIQNSFGQCHYNPGIKLSVNERKYVLDHSREYYLFDIVPVAAVRMTKRDRIFLNPNHVDPLKRQRPAVTKYFAFKRLLELQAKEMNFDLPQVFEALFIVPMPDSWSGKKKEKMNGMPCKSKPDTDNYVKAVCDSLKKEDGDIWKFTAEKRYGHKGSMIIFG